MAFRPARPLSHHTNLQLTDAAADAIKCSFHLVLRAALELESLISSIQPALAIENSIHTASLCLKHRRLSTNTHRHHD